MSAPLFAVRVSRGLVTHWGDGPLLTWEQADACLRAIHAHTGEDGAIERVVYATDVQALRDLAQGWRKVSARRRHEREDRLLGDDPGPHITAIQFEWAANEIERLRAETRTGDTT